MWGQKVSYVTTENRCLRRRWDLIVECVLSRLNQANNCPYPLAKSMPYSAKSRPGNIRLKVLKAVRRERHRYDALRVLGMSVSLGLLFAVPLSGLSRVDLWQGRHYLLYDVAPFKHGLAGVIIGIGLMYVVTFLSNMVAGQAVLWMGLPGGSGEPVRRGCGPHPALKPAKRLQAQLKGAAFSFLFVVSVMAWWVDLRVLWQGSATELAWSWGLLWSRGGRGVPSRALVAMGFLQERLPDRVVLLVYVPRRHGTESTSAIRKTRVSSAMRATHVCPVDLKPRDLMAPVPARAGCRSRMHLGATTAWNVATVSAPVNR